jgi:Anti-sigma-K factor rskA
MSPDFDELVGVDLEPGERARLERVHELLVAAGPPPDRATEQPAELRPRKRRVALLAIAAAFAVFALALAGALVDDGGGGVEVVSMRGTSAAADASATLKVFAIDDAGNWPMELTVDGLVPAASGRTFELWLTRDGAREALCGSFLTGADGSAVVPMNAPYRFDEYDGWVVVEKGSETALLTT